MTRAPNVVPVICGLHFVWQRHVEHVEEPINANGAEQEAREILKTLFGVDDPVLAGMASVRIRARRLDALVIHRGEGRRVFHADETVAGIADRPGREPLRRGNQRG